MLFTHKVIQSSLWASHYSEEIHCFQSLKFIYKIYFFVVSKLSSFLNLWPISGRTIGEWGGLDEMIRCNFNDHLEETDLLKQQRKEQE